MELFDNCLSSLLNELGFCDSEEEIRRKKSSVEFLERLSVRWILDMAMHTSPNLHFNNRNLPCRIMLQGSAALGVSCASSDVDAVLIVPNFVDRDDFFVSFPDYLKIQKDVTDVVAVPETLVPLIRMSVSGVRIDLVISRLSSPYVPAHIDFEQPLEDLYRGMDLVSVRSLSGVHLAQEVKKLTNGFPLFPRLLRIVRAWVSARAIGSYVYGFPPNIAWVILVVYVCKRMANHEESMQKSGFCICKHTDVNTRSSGFISVHISDNQHPHSSSSSSGTIGGTGEHSLSCLIHAFFALFATWPWPHPVQIAPIKVVPDLGIFSWDPQRNIQDERDLMPIITPVFPNKNVSFSVRQVTKKIVTDELQRGLRIVTDILHGQAKWTDLLERYDVRNHYRHFILLTLNAVSREELNVVGGLVDSRLRDLAQLLEDNAYIHSTRISPVQSSHSSNLSGTPAQLDSNPRRQWLVAMDIEPGPVLPSGGRGPRPVNITNCLSMFYQILRERDAYTNFGEKLTHVYLKRPQTVHFRLY
ncbi:hypothetical protein P879_07338 [Paragonimus westermani]|uniref:polynucleotide adenylyltransferase n=1 Tax=Paragonimus westermani TaxID=34504 RepID=A0A8T0DES4_9TREM|nr:hypothetical protein P879_07338 [Paragonimus westermani]